MASLKSCDCSSLKYRPFSGNAVTELGNLIAIGVNEFQVGRGQVVALIH